MLATYPVPTTVRRASSVREMISFSPSPSLDDRPQPRRLRVVWDTAYAWTDAGDMIVRVSDGGLIDPSAWAAGAR